MERVWEVVVRELKVSGFKFWINNEYMKKGYVFLLEFLSFIWNWLGN